MCSTASFAVYSNAPSSRRSSARGILEQRERLVGVRGDDDVVEAADRPSSVAPRPRRRRAAAPARRADPAVPGAARASRRRSCGSRRDRPPAEAAEAEHAVVVEEADRVRGREVERPPGRGRPERRGERDEEVAAEAGASTRDRSRYPRAWAPESCSSSERRAVRSQRADLGQQARNRGARDVPPLANGRRPEHSSPHPPQPTEKDISECCVWTPSSRDRRTSSG